jgi:GTPase SAR1 family protein
MEDGNQALKLVVMGDGSSGKTSIINQYGPSTSTAPTASFQPPIDGVYRKCFCAADVGVGSLFPKVVGAV